MTLRPLTTQEAAATAERAAVSTGAPADEESIERWRTAIRTGTVWGLERDGMVAGHCRLLPTEHWFGGRRVPSLDIASVAVPPERRGQGVAREMMAAAVARGRAEGHGLSLLFPATTAMYRKLGWEHAGTWTRYRAPTASVPTDGPAMRPAVGDADWRAIQSCQRESIRRLSGPAVRRDERWQHLGDAPYRYVLDAIERPGRVEAYALIRQRPLTGDWRHVIVLEDWAATTRRGLDAIAAIVGHWRTFARAVEFVDALPSRWSALLPEQDLERAGGLHWMARALALDVAVAARGFPSGLSAAVSLELQGAPDSARMLEVAGGRGQLTAVAAGDVTLDPRAVGPLFTGFWSADQLALLGLVRGPDEALASLDAAFTGPPPVLFDFF